MLFSRPEPATITTRYANFAYAGPVITNNLSFTAWINSIKFDGRNYRCRPIFRLPVYSNPLCPRVCVFTRTPFFLHPTWWIQLFS